MGVLFTKIEPNHQLVLEKWIAQLMDKLAVVELERLEGRDETRLT